MPRLISTTRAFSGVSAAFALVLLAAVHAYAGKPVAPDTEGGREGGTLFARATAITYDTSRNGSGEGAGRMAVAGGDWTPPACWYAPTMTPEEFRQRYADYLGTPLHTGKAEAVETHEEMYGEDSQYKDHNIDKQGEGMWWEGVMNPSTPAGDPGKLACDEPPFWVENGETPDIENVISPEILAGLAYEQIQVPTTEFELSPADEQTVNLDTWVWSANADFAPVAVTASVEALGIEATTTARPVSFRIEPGTRDAELHPVSGECAIAADGVIGEPYEKGRSAQTPPCGLTYLRAGDYELRATVTWEVAWEGSGGTGGDLPDGTFEAAQSVTVREVQSIVR
ncbi:hypothetical protein JJV70_03420 [Streptomyces sp. JJ66]|uniref:hypothetical protein n=1 Tax=Streptomyces sp. JJ66 TaxID=2803843 RepID=UPI001C56E6CC|nr:hypothetical protein [Streptomyces sp. JJ66]MBW1601167.1 hypothetical protein [Streptomyces sp. JJ66]